MAAASDRPTPSRFRRRRWFLALIVGVVLLFGATGWFDRSRTATDVLESAAQVVVVNDAGPIRIESRPADELEGIEFVHDDSWLVSGPRIEAEVIDGVARIRVQCTSRFPCRSSIELAVPDGTTVDVVAVDQAVDVLHFSGTLSIHAGDAGVVAGPLQGSLRLVTTGPVVGRGLRLDDAEIFSDSGSVDLIFDRSPRRLSIVGSTEPVEVELPNQRFRVSIDSPVDPVIDLRESDTSDRVITIRSSGSIALTR